MAVVPLHLLKNGEHGRVVGIDGDQALVSRLNEMGLNDGQEVGMVRSGTPCIIAVGNHRLSFRGSEAMVILVDTDC